MAHKYLAIALAVLLSACQSNQSLADRQHSDVVTNSSGGRAWYHVKLHLSENGFDINDHYGFIKESGQFELYLEPEALEVAAPNCEEHIKLRMPATLSGDPEAASSIEEKKQLFDDLKSVKKGTKSGAEVVVELNPYVRVRSDSPLELALTRCTVFFRVDQGRYIDTTDPL